MRVCKYVENIYFQYIDTYSQYIYKLCICSRQTGKAMEFVLQPGENPPGVSSEGV